MSHDIACPICGTELTIIQLFSCETTQRAVARLISVGMPLGEKVLQYSTLFAPPKTRLTVPKQIKILLQLLPDLERRAINHRGREWAVPLDVWAQGIDQMLASRDAGRLELPMSGHGYLYSILAGMADKVEGRAEAQAEAARRAPASQGTVTVNGSAMSIGQGLAQVYGGHAAEPAKPAHNVKKPAPASVQAMRDALCRKPSPTSGEKA